MSKRLDTFLLLTTTLFLLQCSEAPYIQLAANRIVLVELFSSTN
ncbi:MAG: hypothetical protein ABIK93_01925 [candidate division WOR-3 bacterium]